MKPATLLLLAICLPANVLADRFSVSVAMQRHASGNYYVHGGFDDGTETDFLVDTGSGYVALTRDTFSHIRDLPGTEYLRDIPGATANGRIIKVPIYRVAELKLGDSCLLKAIEIAVLPQGTRDILGLSALRRLEPFALQLDPPELLVSQCSGKPVREETPPPADAPARSL
jgi:clan AA aspartic protease (TIGR02281 family)